jgi:vacuolar-type H+-ATPase subunit H
VDENAIEELEFHKQTVQSDENSPLHLIREKEMEISGRVLAAKREADEIVADARKQAAKTLAEAHDAATAEVGELDAAVQTDLQASIEQVRAQAESDAAALEETIGARQGKAAEYVVASVTRI